MKSKLCVLIFCLGVMLTILVGAQGDEPVTFGAYPGAPASTTGQSTQVAGTVSAYPGIPASPTGQSTQVAGTVSAYPVSSTPSTVTVTTTAEYYMQAPPATQQNELLVYNVQTAPPTAIYYSGTFMPWTSFYQVFPAKSPALWIATSYGWSWYATCPLGSWVRELIYVPTTGTMKLYELCPDGTTKYSSYGWAYSGYKYMWFHAGTAGRHVLMVTISDNPSNYVTIDVV